VLLRYHDEDIQADKARRRLHTFVQQAWPIVEPKAPFVDNWHIGFLAEHLEAVHFGQITDLLINVPPGCMKSQLTSVMFPVWEWGPRGRPDLRYLCGSYDVALSIRDARRARDIITSPWYERHFRSRPTPWTLRPDQNTKTRYDNTLSGWRIATSVGGKGTGEHPHRKLIDDPHNVKESLSELGRQEAITWFDLTMGSRGLALKAATIVIMQRLHEEDLSGHILETLRDQFDHICLCMRHEPKRMVETRIGKTDPRTTPGELLWPALLDEPKVAKLEGQLRASQGEFGVAGQLQQRPAPETGGIFQREWLQIVEAVPADAQILRRYRGWDAAGTAGGGDWTVGVKVALARDGIIYVEDVVRAQIGPGDDEKLMKQTADLDGRTVAIIEEQEGGSAGKKVIAAHAKLLAGYDYRGEAATGDKVTRARPFAAQARVGNVRLVRGAWNKAYVDEFALFPNAKHDDQVDGTSTAYNALALAPVTSVKPRRISGF
jgi:predicted phage terminase large subunit-like protein